MTLMSLLSDVVFVTFESSQENKKARQAVICGNCCYASPSAIHCYSAGCKEGVQCRGPTAREASISELSIKLHGLPIPGLNLKEGHSAV